MSEAAKHDDPAWLEEQYHEEELTLREVADRAGVSDTTIYRRMCDFGIDRRPKSSYSISRSSSTRHATIRTDAYGHRAFTSKHDGERDWLTLHRLHATLLVDDISELDGKEVHHKNGCPFDNRLENYEITTKADHQRKHHFTLPPYKSLCTTCGSVSYFFDDAIATYCSSCGTALDSVEVLETQSIDWKIDH